MTRRKATKRETEGTKLRAIRESELKRRDTLKLRELAGRIKLERAKRAGNLKQIRELCRWGRVNIRSRVAQLRAATREQLNSQIAALRHAERASCATDQATARAELDKVIDAARGELVEARRSYKHTYGRKSSRSSAKERREESADEVAHNLPPELVPVWRSVQHSIHGGPRRSRTEAFLEWAEENPDVVHGVMYEQADRDVARLVAEHQATEVRLAKAKRGRGYRDPADVAAALAGVPF